MGLPRFVWQRAYETGIPEVDMQHRMLFDAINRLADILESGSTISLRDLNGSLAFLKYYAEWHFQREERIFEKRADDPKHPLLCANRRAHARFNSLAQEWYRRFLAMQRDGASPVQVRQFAQDLYYELIDWVENHVLQVDRRAAAVCAHCPLHQS
ncbi:MAG: hemerythrin family protein [Chloroflexi bacterium]|nr:hemerythrin family protein [Chloroflexota bacterium]